MLGTDGASIPASDGSSGFTGLFLAKALREVQG